MLNCVFKYLPWMHQTGIECTDGDSGYPDDFIPATSSATSTAMPVKIVGYDFSTVTTSTDFKVDPVITGGEIIIIFFLVLFSFIMILRFLAKSIDRITTNKKYLGYHGGDVEIRKDI